MSAFQQQKNSKTKSLVVRSVNTREDNFLRQRETEREREALVKN